MSEEKLEPTADDLSAKQLKVHYFNPNEEGEMSLGELMAEVNKRLLEAREKLSNLRSVLNDFLETDTAFQGSESKEDLVANIKKNIIKTEEVIAKLETMRTGIDDCVSDLRHLDGEMKGLRDKMTL